MPQSQTRPVSCNDTSVFQNIIKSMKYLKSYHPETIFLFLETVTLTLTPPAPKFNLSRILRTVYQTRASRKRLHARLFEQSEIKAQFKLGFIKTGE